MATTHPRAESKSGLARRLFVDHPRSLGMSWAEHGMGAIVIGATLVGAGAACLVHALVPGWFTQTAGKTVERMHDHMIKRKEGAANPENWPDYEI
ncbi:MAG TPA: DUF6356 family protein [Sphingomicrobium sp.]|jgi:hypothetical protein|nr:DUF6356 family protein [Sphingomicrobium sp.]